MKYKYTVKFKFDGDTNHIYNMIFQIEASTHKEACVKGNQRWLEQVNNRESLKSALIIKTICRKIETKPRTRKTGLQKVLAVLNQYIMEDLSK